MAPSRQPSFHETGERRAGGLIVTVLIAYASAMGSTREIAQRVATRMAAGLGEVECRSVEEVESVAGYKAVVVGSAIHNQAWLPPAASFLARHAPELAKRPVWAFSVGMADALPKPFRKRGAALQQARLAGVLSRDIPLRGHRLFSGVYEAAQMPALLRLVFRLTGGRFGDLRDWAAVDAWTDEITDQLKKPAR
ncbi:flavodoxin-like protein [Arthrobacter sp. FB24]|nr:flavodoxin-like protein [Arthrobacter sp. FB24]